LQLDVTFRQTFQYFAVFHHAGNITYLTFRSIS